MHASPSLVSFWHLRAELARAVRSFFTNRGSLELDTPIGVPCPGTEVHLQYFASSWLDHAGRAHPLYLRSSPELHLKQAVAEGASRVFQLARCFRNGGELSEWHHPEFTMLEWYETGIDFDAFIDQTEALLHDTAAALEKPLADLLGRRPPRLPRRMPRLSVAEAFREFAGLDLVDEDPDLARQARAAGILSPREDDDFETAFFKILIEKVEPGLAALGSAVLLDYPASQAALATVRQKEQQAPVAKRFEIYIGRVELCNGFEELLDQQTNMARIRAAFDRRRELGLPIPEDDQHFYAALGRGLPPCCGNALGFDRWLALLAGEPSLDRIVPFRAHAPYAHLLSAT